MKFTKEELTKMSEEDNFSWIKIKKVKEIENKFFDPSEYWKAKYEALENHHLEETKYLIKKVNDLANELLNSNF